MVSGLTAAVIAVATFMIVFTCFGGMIGYLYVVDRRKARRRAEAALAAAQERRNRRRRRFPAALPGPDDYELDEPALGNIVIKDEAQLEALRRDLVAMHVAPRPCYVDGDASATVMAREISGASDDEATDEAENAAESENEAEAHNDPARDIVELLDTTAMTAEVPPRRPRTLSPRTFFQSLRGGGYVIVECELPSSVSLRNSSSVASTLSTVGPRDEEMMEVDMDGAAVGSSTTAAATMKSMKGSITQYFRFQRCSSPYGTSQYLAEHPKD